jgi:tetraacyldisaccharide 4'-kinase
MQALASQWLARGPLAWALRPLSWLYAALVAVRRVAYRRGFLRRVRLRAPVVIVGNLVAGGAGKTPAVLATVALLRRAGWRPGIVSRGYGRATSDLRHVEMRSDARDVGDEPLLLRLRGGVPVTVARDRPAAALALLDHHPEIDVIVSDDGLQHLALDRDVSVLVFDERGVGNGWLLPAGPLRESMPASMPPTSVVLYNASAPTTALPGFISQRRLAGAVALDAWWAGAAPSMERLHALADRPLLAAAGIARPERFFEMLRAAGLDFERVALPDHHRFASLPWPATTSDVAITEKDAVKLRPERWRALAGDAATRVWVVALDFEPDPAYGATLLHLLAARAASR